MEQQHDSTFTYWQTATRRCRMPVTKRIRFEILRRDSHACQYCGQVAPDVVLTIDHVMPVALGGSDLPDNLITACKDCNAGKTSIAPDSPFVAAVGDRAAAYALGLLDKMTRLRAGIEEGDAFARQFNKIWCGWKTGSGSIVSMPYDWESTLHRWFRMGVPMRMIELATSKAMMLPYPKGEHGEFKYMCGIIWNQINNLEVDYTVTTETAAVYTEAEKAEYGDGVYQDGWQDGWDNHERFIDELDLVAHLIDGRTNYRIDALRVA